MATAPLDDHRQRNFDIVLRAFAAVGAGDADAQVANYTDDIVLEFPFTDPPTVVPGRSAVHERLKNAFKVFQFDLAISEVHPCLDPDEHRALVDLVENDNTPSDEVISVVGARLIGLVPDRTRTGKIRD